MFKSLDLQKTPWKDLGPRNLALAGVGDRGGGGGPFSGASDRRRRGGCWGKARGGPANL